MHATLQRPLPRGVLPRGVLPLLHRFPGRGQFLLLSLPDRVLRHWLSRPCAGRLGSRDSRFGVPPSPGREAALAGASRSWEAWTCWKSAHACPGKNGPFSAPALSERPGPRAVACVRREPSKRVPSRDSLTGARLPGEAAESGRPPSAGSLEQAGGAGRRGSGRVRKAVHR